jgi:group I intron endonuclease
MKTFIYILVDENNGPRYVGKSDNPNKRLKDHIYESKRCDSKSHRVNWINSMLSKGLVPKVEIIDEVPNDEWEFWEGFWIDQFKQWGFSLTNGSIGGFGFTKGHIVSDETKEKNRLAATGNKNKRGKAVSIETRGRMSKARLGKELSIETRDRMSKARLGKKGKRCEKTILILSKEVIQYDLDGNFIKEHKSGVEAKLETGASKISEVCNGKRKSSGGFYWKFKS